MSSSPPAALTASLCSSAWLESIVSTQKPSACSAPSDGWSSSATTASESPST